MPSQAKTVYLKPTSWVADGARFALYMYGGASDAWANFELVDATNNIYKATFDDSQTNMIFCRMNGSSTENIWDNRWNQSDNLAAPTADNLLYTITEGRWGKDSDGNENGKIADGDGLTTEAYTEPVAAGYTVDFNTAITTSNHDFAVAKGWSHIVPNSDYDGYGPYYMSYSYYASMGVDGTGALWAGRQYAGDNSGGEVVKDILVTPLVNGTITLDVKAYSNASSSNPAFVEVYAINADGTLGSLLKTVKEDIAAYNGTGTADWATFTLAELTAEQKLGLRCQYVYIDNFTAASVNIPAERKLEVTKVANLEGATGTSGTTTYFEQQADGTLKVQLQVTLTNTGDYDFAAGDEGYTLTLASATYASGSKTYYDDATVNISEALAAGESKTIDVDFFIPFSTGWKYFFVRENITGTTSSSNRYAGVTAYESKFVFREKGSTSTSSLTVASWGTISESTTKEYEVANLGTAPLTITSYTQPEGFTLGVNLISLPEGVTVDMVNQTVTVAGGASVPFTVTQDASATGTYTGTLSIGYKNFGSEEATNYTLNFSATVIGANTWFADFNTITSSSTNYPEGSVAESGIRFGTTYVADANYDGYLYSYTSSSYASANNKFITPKLHANAGDQLAFDVRRDESSSSTYNLKVYISTDRKTWGDPVYSVTAADLTSTFQTKEISFDTEGDYYVAFAIYGVCVDNLIGLEKVDVAHDLYIKSVSWPDASIKNGSAQTKPSVEVIPLTNETADSYTVKYVCGETVLGEGTPVALTASANSSKTIAINWTPNVESTTTFEGTKVVFEFTGGTKVETETFDLTVTNEPIFHFVKTLPSSKWYEPTDYTTPITFGKTNTADSQTFYINNWGSAPLTVKSITLPVGFSTSVETPLTVAAFNGETDGIAAASQALDIIFSATEAGEYSGDMVITYVNAAGEDANFTIAVSGTKLDPNGWYANFDDGGWPAGSVYQDNVSITNGGTYSVPNYYITSSSATNNLFITPKLTATAGDKLAFDAKLYSGWNEGKVVVYAAATRDELVNFDADNDTRTVVFTASGSDETNTITTDYQTFEIPAVEGDNYYAFEISNRPYVDELYGLKLTEVAHDWTLVSSNIPTEAMQNVASTASVNILNLGLQDEAAEDITVTAYVNGEAVATGEGVAIPMSHQLSDAGTQLSISFTYPKTGTYPVYVEVKAGDYNVQTDPVDVTFAEEEAQSEASAEADGCSNMIPLYLNYYNSESVSLYTSNVLKNSYGLTNGAKIKSITYKGYKETDEMTSTLNVWYEWTTDESQTKPANGLYNTEGMNQLIADQEKTWAKKGSSSSLEDMITLTFDEPLVYEEGKALRIVMRSNSTSWKNAYFEKGTSATSGLTYYHYNDTKSTFESNAWTSSVLPVLHMELEATAATLSGTVKDAENAAVEGATVTLVSTDGDNIQYSGTTDAEGAYSINVIQATREYNVTVTKEGLPDATATVAFNGESQTKDFYMVEPMVVTFVNGAGWENVNAYTYDEEWSGTWPGTEISKTGTTTIQGVEYDVYTYSLQAPTAPAKIIFNNGGSGDGNQTDNLDFADGEQYVYGITYYSVAGAFRANGAEEDEAGIFGTAWATELNDMTMNDEGLYELSFTDVELTKGTLKFKVVENHTWTTSYPDNNYEVYIENAGTYNLTITFNAESKEVSHNLYYEGPITITMSSLKYATLYYENVNLVVPEGLVAYAAVVGDKVDLQQFAAAGDVIPAGTPVVLGGEAGDYEFGITEETGMAPAANDLIGSEEGGKDEEAGYKYYVLNRKNGVAGFYFQKGSAGAYADVKPHQAYLKVDASLAKAGGYGFDDVATGIDSIDAGMLTDNDKVYTLSGVRVNANRVAKGVYIVNGQKVVIK